MDVDTEQERVLAIRGDRENPYSLGYTCVKGRAVPEAVHHPQRLLSWKKRVEGGWVDISSEHLAFDEIGATLVRMRDRFGRGALRRGTLLAGDDE